MQQLATTVSCNNTSFERNAAARDDCQLQQQHIIRAKCSRSRRLSAKCVRSAQKTELMMASQHIANDLLQSCQVSPLERNSLTEAQSTQTKARLREAALAPFTLPTHKRGLRSMEHQSQANNKAHTGRIGRSTTDTLTEVRKHTDVTDFGAHVFTRQPAFSNKTGWHMRASSPERAKRNRQVQTGGPDSDLSAATKEGSTAWQTSSGMNQHTTQNSNSATDNGSRPVRRGAQRRAPPAAAAPAPPTRPDDTRSTGQQVD